MRSSNAQKDEAAEKEVEKEKQKWSFSFQTGGFQQGQYEEVGVAGQGQCHHEH